MALEYAEQIGALYYEISAKEDFEGVTKMFTDLAWSMWL
jgi:hypothetical protein